MEENQVHIPDGWKKTSFGDKELFRIIGSGIKHFSGEKEYYSTSSINGNKVLFAEQLITFKNRPSRANMQPIENSVWFAKMKNTFKILKAQRKEIEEVILSTGFSGIESETVDCDYLMQILSSSEFNSQKNLLAEGSTQEAVNNTKIKEIKFLLPKSKQEQTTIARILAKVDEAIAQTEQLIAKYTRIKTGLMQDLLTKGIDQHGNIRSEESHEFKDSPLGRIPVEWEMKKLYDICIKIVDCPHSTPTYLNDGVFVARTQNIKNGNYLTESSSYVSEGEFKERTLRLEPKFGDIIFTREAPIGEAFVIPKGMRICLGQRVMLFRLDNLIMMADFLVELIYSEGTKFVFDAITGGTTVSHLNVKDVKDLYFIVPSIEEQSLILRQLTKSKALINSLENQLSKLQSLKTGLMQDLLSGKVRVNHLIKETASI